MGGPRRPRDLPSVRSSGGCRERSVLILGAATMSVQAKAGTEPAEGARKRGKRRGTEAMITSNRLNSTKSTGPSKEGCKISSRNSMRHGMASQKICFLPGEDVDAFWAQVARSARENGVQTTDDLALVEMAVYSLWTR